MALLSGNSEAAGKGNKLNLIIRDADAEKDAAAVVSIYTPIVIHTPFSFEYDPPNEQEMKRRILATQENFPWLICEEMVEGSNGSSNHVAGYAYANRHRVRDGYRWVAETSVYVSESYQGKGVGSLVYKKLCEILAHQGYFQALAIVVEGNEGSARFHERQGFQLVGSWKNCGNKFGKWHTDTWYSKNLQPEFSENPQTPVPYQQIKHNLSM